MLWQAGERGDVPFDELGGAVVVVEDLEEDGFEGAEEAAGPDV